MLQFFFLFIKGTIGVKNKDTLTIFFFDFDTLIIKHVLKSKENNEINETAMFPMRTNSVPQISI